jgi:type I restriction enzyme S subunit
LGKCVVAQVEGEKWAFDSHLMRIRLRADRADPVWLQALLSSEGGRRLFLEKTRRTAVQFNINTKEMATIRVPVPPIDRQCAFATWVTQAGGLESQQRSASVAAEGAFQSLLAGVFQE